MKHLDNEDPIIQEFFNGNEVQVSQESFGEGRGSTTTTKYINNGLHMEVVEDLDFQNEIKLTYYYSY